MQRPRRSVFSALMVVMLIAGLGFVAVTASAQVTVPVTVTISRVTALDEPGDTADMYGRVTINGAPTQESGEVGNDNDIEPFWVFTANIDISLSPIPITIEVWDDDDFPFLPDDVIDLNPVDNKTSLVLLLDLTAGTWTFGGDPIADNATSSTGDGDREHFGLTEGGEQGRIFFDISILSATGDADGDGLLDGWETNGYDADGDGTIDVDLPAFGADPNHKDLFLELDYETGQTPTRAGIQRMKTAFANAPIGAGTNASALPGGVNANNNPDGLPGINLWVDTGSLTDPTASEDGAGPNTCSDGIDNGFDGADGADSDCLVGDNLGGGNSLSAGGACNLDSDFYAAKAANFDSDRRLIFRYGISAVLAAGCPSSGGWGEIGGNDFIDFNHDGGTIMHEFGHTLNLRHGGFENTNCKPNYVSVMNYDQQFGINQNGGGSILDFSPPRYAGTRSVGLPPALVENNLDEALILDALDTANQFVFSNGLGNPVRNPLNARADWNGDGDTNDSGVTVNLNTSSGSCTDGSSSQTLNSHNDWARIALQFRQFGDAADGAINPVTEPEPTLDELLQLVELLNTADIEIAKGDSADPAVAGETLTYTLTVTNNGPNPASDIEVVDTLPAGVSYVSNDSGCAQLAGVVTCNLGELLAGEDAVIEITVLIDPDLVFIAGTPTSITNNAVVSNLVGPDPDPSNNEVSEDTSVVAEADLEIVSYEAVDAPNEIIVGEDVEITTRKVITNNGPSSPMNTALTPNAVASPGTTATPISVVTAEPALGDDQREVLETYRLSCQAESAHQFTFTNEIQPLDPADTDPDQSNNTAELVVAVECVVPVQINIKPGSYPNSVNPNKGTVTVAILTTEAGEYGLPLAFDATRVDPLSVRFGPRDEIFAETGGAAEQHDRGHWRDSRELDERTRDGDTDLVLHFKTADTGIAVGDTEACVKGEWVDGAGAVHKFFGCDTIRITPNAQ